VTRITDIPMSFATLVEAMDAIAEHQEAKRRAKFRSRRQRLSLPAAPMDVADGDGDWPPLVEVKPRS
jgi:hypothetical protein